MSKPSKSKADKHLLIAGNDEFSVKEMAREFVAAHAPGDPMNLEVLDGQVDTVDAACQEIAKVCEALQTVPFFGGSKLVHFKSCTFLADSVVGRSERVQQALQGLLDVAAGVCPQKEVLLVISAIGVDRRKAFYKNWHKMGEVEQCDLADLSGRGEEHFIRDVERMFRDAGLLPQEGVARQMVELLGNDMRALHMEMEKLSLYLMPRKNVEMDDLLEVVSQTRGVMFWDLNDAVVAGDSRRAWEIYRLLKVQGTSEVAILMVMGSHLRLTALTVYLRERGWIKMSGSRGYVNASISPQAEALLPSNKDGKKPASYRLAKILEKAGKSTSQQWFEVLEVLHKTHIQLVSGGGVDTERVFEAALMKMCRA